MWTTVAHAVAAGHTGGGGVPGQQGLCGLDQHQVRRWRCWFRWVTLAMLAYAFLVVAAVTERARHPAPPGMIELTCNEIQHLFAVLAAAPVADRGRRLRWSWWRRRRQARTRALPRPTTSRPATLKITVSGWPSRP